MSDTTKRWPRGDRRGVGNMTESEFAAAKFDWLRRVALDNELPARAPRIAVILVTDFLRYKEGGIAFMSQETLAKRLGLSRQRVSSTLALMEGRGHLVDLATDGRTKRYVIGPGSIGSDEKINDIKTDTWPDDMSHKRDTSAAATCHDLGSHSHPGPEPISRQYVSPNVDSTCHDLGSQKDRRIKAGELKTGDGSLRSLNERENPVSADFDISGQVAPKPSPQIAAAEQIEGCQEARPGALPTKAAPASKPEKLPRVSGQCDLLSLSAAPKATPSPAPKATARSGRARPYDPELSAFMIEFRQVYPAGANTPTQAHHEAWAAVTEAARKKRAEGTSFADMLDGARRYAVSSPNPDRVFSPRNWLVQANWKKTYAPAPPPEAPRNTGSSAGRSSGGYDDMKPNIDRLRAFAATGPKTDVSGI